MKSRILLIEDNPLTAKGITYLLERENYHVAAVSTLAAATAHLATEKCDLILLDIALPDGESFDFAHQLKQKPSTEIPAIIFLTAKDDEEDIIHGLELGEDYITKPFRNRELLLRVRNLLQRNQPIDSELTYGIISLNPKSGEVAVADKKIALTALETKILRCLLENAGHTVPRARLLDEIWDASGSVVNDNTLSVYLKRLRQKLAVPDLIVTIKNLGYRLQKIDTLPIEGRES